MGATHPANSNLYPSRLSVVIWILVLLGVQFTPLSSTIISYDGDAAHHALIGKLIISEFKIPETDPTAFTASDKRFIAHEWLAEVVYGTFDYFIGPSGIALVASLLLGASLYLIAISLERSSISSKLIIIIIPVIFFLLRIHFLARPHLFTWPLFIMLYLTVDSFRRGLLSTSSLGIRLGVVFILWTNFHGSFVFAFCCLMLLLISPLLLGVDRKKVLNLGQTVLLFIFLGACTLLNPFGFELHKHIFSFLFEGQEIRSYISEFGNASLDTAWYVLAAIYTFASLIVIFCKRNKNFIEDYLLLLALIALSIYSIRMVTYLFLILPLVAFNSYSARVNVRFHTNAIISLALTSIVYILIINFIPRIAVKFDENLLPVKGVEYLKSNALQNEGEIFNAYDWGGYLAYSLYPDYKVFIHGLNDHYGLDLLIQYNHIIGLSDRSEALLKSNNIDRVIFPANTQLANTLLTNPNWKAVYQDATCVILDRKS